ncbi:hypothetical protein RHMOL_Rhmol01G0257000 [Rhododendron molle]|uniref:Uncharacterized protein n=1 Tax=Rhododendron molle TaxID=49168 RepID=A0ACC0Q7A9_RHOML|nr:hypothetical protein RHMOL_Rhmol01G0257000 [Rhododendron molle]
MFGKNKRRSLVHHHHMMDAKVAKDLSAAIVVDKILGRMNYVHLAMLLKGEWPKWRRILPW